MQHASTHKAVRNYKMEAAYKFYLVFEFVAIAEEMSELGSEVVVQKQITNIRTPCVINVVCK
jgi:phage-related holin